MSQTRTQTLPARIFRSRLVAACLIGVGIIAGAATPAVPPPPAPATIGLVDLGKLLDSLHESKIRNGENEEAGKTLQAELDKLKDQVEKIMNDIKPGGAIPEKDYKARSEAMVESYQKAALLKASKESYQTLYDVRRSNIVHELYDKVIVAVDAFAKREGYDLVMMDDRTAIPLPPANVATAQDLLPLIKLKRVLYAKDGMDITDRLITIMNNQYDATAPAPTLPAPAPAPAPGAGATNPPPKAGPK